MNEYLDLLDSTPTAPKPPASAPRNDYLALLDDDAEVQRRRLQGTLATSVSINPDTYAANKQLAKYVGVPPIVAQTIPDEIKRQADVQRVKTDVADAPVLARKFTDQDFAQLAHDDSGPLSAIESAIRYLVSAPNAPRGGMVADAGNLGVSALKGAVGLPQSIVGLADIPTLGRAGQAVESAGLRFKDAQSILDTFYSDAQQQANKRVRDSSGFLGTLGAMAENPSTIVQTGVESLPVMLGGAGVARGLLTVGEKTLAAGVAGPALPGFLARTFGQAAPLVAGAAGEGVMAAGSAAENYRQAGGVLTVGQVAAAIASGAGTGALSVIGGKVAQKLGVADIDTALASGALKGEEVKKGLIRTLAEAGVSEGLLEEMPQSAQEQIWQNIATDKPAMEGVAEAAAQGLMAGAATGGAFAGISRRLSRETQGAAQAQLSAQQLDTIAALADASKLRERSPETFQQFAQDLADAHTPAIFVDAQALMQSGVNIDEVAKAMPSVAAQLQQAVATGGDIEIPTAEFVAAVPGSTFQQQMIDHARTGANAMSRAEAEVFMKDKGDAIKAEIEAEADKHEQDATWQMQRDEVRAGFEQQLNAAGRFQPAVNKSYAAVLGDFYAVTASRAGMTPHELVQRYPLKIQAQMPGGQANVMEQAGPARTRVESSKDGMTKHSILNDAGEVIGSMSVLDRNTLVNGEPVGVAQIHNVGIDDAQAKGNGYGVQAYREVIDAALSAGKVVWSDPSVSADAQHIYEALKRRGYTVETNSAKPATKEADGTMVSKGSFVYRVTAGPKALNQSAGAQTLADVRAEWDEAGVKHAISEKGGTIEVGQIVVPAGQRGQGAGTAAMRKLLAYADATGQRVVLTPSSDFGGTKSRLVKFYKGLGFKENKGRSKDFSTMAGMIREPAQALNQSAKLPATIEIDGKQRSTTNSKGQPIASTEEGVRSFWKWFGDSKVVDAEGRPLVVYHGTETPGFDAFVPGGTADSRQTGSTLGLGVYLTTDPSDADIYAGKSGAVMPLYVRGKLLDLGSLTAQQLREMSDWANANLTDGDRARFEGSRKRVEFADRAEALDFFKDRKADWQHFDGISERGKPKAISEGEKFVVEYVDHAAPVALQSAGDVETLLGAVGWNSVSDFGYDGAVIPKGDARKWVVMYRPAGNVKSATGNSGAFDPANPSILNQGQTPRAQISFGPSIADSGAVISLLENADLSSFIHELGHLFLEIQADLAARIQANIDAGENVTDGERQIVADMNRLLEWFGVKGTDQASGMTGGALDQPAYHGTPHRGIDKFSTDKIGTGEGNQAYGWGLYFASKREISEWYRKALSDTHLELNGEPLEAIAGMMEEHFPPVTAALLEHALNDGLGGAKAFIDHALLPTTSRRYLTAFGDDAVANATREELEAARDALAKVKEVSSGQLYEVDIPEDSEMLLWDKPLSEQPEKVSEALTRLLRANDLAGMIDSDRDGQSVYKSLGLALKGFGSKDDAKQKAASESLMAAGIKGIKYLDGTSRNAGDGSHNYVIFSGDDVAIRQTFYQGGQEGEQPGPSPQGRTALETWSLMSLEEKRQHHETFARGWERFAFEGNSPNVELQTIFQRFAAWMKSIYRTLTSLNVNLTDEVRGVMDRMIATEEQIKEAETARAMGPLFTEQGGMTPEQWAAYQARGEKATQTAVDALQARALADMKWLSNARAKKLRELQAKADELRREIRREVTRDVMARPVYRAWQFLTMKGEADDRAVGEPRVKGSAGELDVTRDNIFQAIAKLGGLNRDELASQWGHDHKAESIQSGVFGRPVVRKEGGLSIDAMTERLVEEGYLMPDEHGRGDPRDLETAFDSQRMGVDQFAMAHDYAEKAAAANGEAPAEALPEHVTHGKLDTNVLREMYGTQAEAIWRKLSDRRMTSENGIQPDVLAETMGFASGDAMVRELANARAPRDVIRDLTDQRMLQEHGELSTPEGLDKATTEALANKVRTRFLAQELQALEDAGKAQDKPGKDGKQRSTASALDKAAEVYAARAIGAMQIKDIKPHKFEAAATRAAKLAAKAFKAGKTAEAAMHKRSELIQMHAAKAAHEALAEVDKARDQFGKINNRPIDKLGKTYDVDVVQAIRAVLAEYGLSTKGEQAAKYLEAVERNDPDMHKVLKAQIDAMAQQAKPFDTLTVDGMRALVDEIGAMWHLARRSKQMEVDGNLIDREGVQEALLARLEEIGIPDHMPGEGKSVTDKERRISRIREAGAALMRVENWAIRKDGADNGVFTRFIFRPIKAASDAYRHERGQVLKKYRDLLAGVDLGVGRISAPELGYEFGFSKGGSGKQELLHAILHTGNDSNKRKLLLGRKWADVMQDGETVDTGRWDRFIERMTREGKLTRADFDFVQGVWDLLESLKPAAQKTHRDVFGRYFDEITAKPVTNSLGTWRGGYVPAMTDAEVVKDAKTRDLAEAENSTMAFAFPSTAKGFTKARVEYNKPLLLDLRALAGHIDKVLLFSHLEQPVRDVRRILTSGQVAEPMHKVDPAAFGSLITPWLNRAARQQVETPIPGDGGAMRVLSKLRARAGMAAMMANLSNTVQQIAGFSIAAVKVPPRHLLSAAHRYITSPRKVTEAVCEASLAMRERADNEAHTMTQEIQQILLNPSLYERAQDWSARHAYFMQSAVDNVMGPIIWTGAYNHALEQGHTEDDARAIADGIVRTTQGSTLAEDIARIETGNAWWRMFAQFAGYFNMQANLLGTEFSNQMHGLGLRKGMGKGLYIFTLGFLVPALLSELIVQAFRGGPDDEDKDGETLDDWLAALGMGTIRGAIAMVPVGGQAANYAINLSNTKPYDDRISTAPAISMLESAIRAPFSVYEAAVNDKSAQKAVRDVATLISITTGLPANAIARPAGYVAGMVDDKINPTGPADLARGLVTGVASPGSKQ